MYLTARSWSRAVVQDQHQSRHVIVLDRHIRQPSAGKIPAVSTEKVSEQENAAFSNKNLQLNN
eukprot:1160078-Pelagomonas_calceolata.AAC.4